MTGGAAPFGLGGAMGIDAVSKQSKADIIVFGLGPMAMEIVKNIFNLLQIVFDLPSLFITFEDIFDFQKQRRHIMCYM